MLENTKVVGRFVASAAHNVKQVYGFTEKDMVVVGDDLHFGMVNFAKFSSSKNAILH